MVAGSDKPENGSDGPIINRGKRAIAEPGKSPAKSNAPASSAPPPVRPGIPEVPPPPTGGEVYKLKHDGKFGEIFVLFLINLLLTLVTLGIYRFWGKTRIRKYVWGHTSLNGERIEYNGTGLELFLGFLFAVLVFFSPVLLIYVWMFTDPPTAPEQLILFVGLVYGIAIILYFLYYVAIFAAYRYRISRTAWMGLRGGMEGSAWKYGFLGFGLGLLNGLTLGWTKPWADSVVFKYRFDRTWFGSKKFTSTMDCQGMYGPFAFAWVGTAIVAAISFGLLAAYFIDAVQTAKSGGAVDQASLQLYMVLAYAAPLIVYSLGIAWYKAALVRNIANTLYNDRARFHCEITGGQMWKLLVPNFLLLIFTLGLAYPYVVLRTARYTAEHLSIVGSLDVADLQQSEIDSPWYGEGIMEFLGVGMI